ncbi:NCS2 family permease [Streptomyces aculeolatus]|uniref:NCS2 family permease n=1 Tax=Streptomyces aculeolatus TaxID=270689 RepID=UPI00055ACB41|nr:NCS2 family permease [Streptomyces aculeolatus]
MPPTAKTASTDPGDGPPPRPSAPRSRIDAYFHISRRGSSVTQELRGGLATFFAMAYIIVLNPIILGSATDKFGHKLDHGELVTATVLVAAVTTLLMGVIGNVPVACAAGLGINAVVSLQLAPEMSWADAMGMVVLAGLIIMLLVATGLRERVMSAIPDGLRKAIAIGIGLFIALVGLVDAGFVTRNPDSAQTTVPLTLGTAGHLKGWPVLVFMLGLGLTFVLLARRFRGAILVSIVTMTLLAMIIHATGNLPAEEWGLTAPVVPDNIVEAPHFGLLGEASLFGGFREAGILTGCLFVFTVLLSGFFDAMGTILGVTEEARLLDEHGRLPEMNRVLMADGAAVALGGAASASASTAFAESTAGVGEGARTGLANLVTGAMFLLALVFTPLVTIVPSQAATPALVVVGYLILSANIRSIDWSDPTIAAPAFLTIILMPFSYSITVGIGIGFLAHTLLRTAVGRPTSVRPALWVTSAVFVVYFALDPIERWLGLN